jgi:hypothetical protein
MWLFRAVGDLVGLGSSTSTVLVGHTHHCWCLALTTDTLFSGMLLDGASGVAFRRASTARS